MPSAVHTMTVVKSEWKGDVKAMMADGRLTKVNVVNGKTLYALDRKKLGMVAEWDNTCDIKKSQPGTEIRRHARAPRRSESGFTMTS